MEDIEQARMLFNKAAFEKDPSRKLAMFKDALDAVEAILIDDSISQDNQNIGSNLRRSNTRGLIKQLATMRNIDSWKWFDYTPSSLDSTMK